MSERTHGWKKDKYDPRDLIYKTVRPESLPPVIDLSRYLPRDQSGKVLVRNQGAVGSCTGHGIGVNLCAQAVKLGIWPEQAFEWFSPTWIYNGARFLEGTLAQDAGAYPKDCLDWLLKNGTLLDHFWPYDPTGVDKTAPGTTRMKQAVQYPDFEYDRAVDGVAGILSALNDGHFVSIGAPWFARWSGAEVDSTGVLPEVTKDDETDGGHETCIIKADQTARMFIGINSWGEGWGGSFGIEGATGGFYALPFSAIDAYKGSGGYDGHVLCFNKLQPAPTPTPPVPPAPPKPGCLLGSLAWLIGK